MWNGRIMCADRSVYGSEYQITAGRKGFDKTGILRIILEGAAEFLQRSIQAAVKINVCPFGPKGLPEFFASDDLTWFLQKKGKDAERLVLDFKAYTLA
jgi:hypothetical protein